MFMITYTPQTIGGVVNHDKRHITRRGKWDSQCKTWNSKKGIPCMTYFDVDANGYRTATGQYEVLEQ